MAANRGFWIIIAITSIVVFFNMGGIPLLDPDEPVYAETPKEMFLFNEFVSPRIFGEYWYDKPPMYYWLVALSYQIFGINEFAARFPSALLSILCVLVIYMYGRKLFSERAAVASALVLATSIEYFYLAKAAVTDITLTFFLSVTLLAFLRKHYYVMYIAAAFATLTKGPVGLLFPGAIILSYLLLSRNFATLKDIKLPAGIILYSIIALPWYFIMYKIHGGIFIDTFLGFHNITRFTSPEHPEGVLWYYFIPVLIIGFFPWTGIVIQSVWNSLTNSRDKFSALLYLNIWAAFIFLFFSISQTKLVSYILPMFPPLALIVGWHIDQLYSKRIKIRLVGWGIGTSGLATIFGIGIYLFRNELPGLETSAFLLVATLMTFAIGSAYFAYKRQVMHMVGGSIAGMIFLSGILSAVLFPAAAAFFSSQNIAQELTRYYDGKSPVYIIKFLRPGVAFYSNIYGQEIVRPDEISQSLQNREKTYYVLRKIDYDRVGEVEKSQLTVIVAVADKMVLVSQ